MGFTNKTFFGLLYSDIFLTRCLDNDLIDVMSKSVQYYLANVMKESEK